MAGPTPVSALLHSATLVTAGIFLLLKFAFIFQLTIVFNFVLLFFGFFTVLFISLAGFYQTDIKGVIAHSTGSQMAYLILSCVFFNSKFAFFHLLLHGLTKSAIFLILGILLHYNFELQNLRRFGGFLLKYNSIYTFFLILIFSLIGVPFFSIFFSKEQLIELILVSNLRFSIISFYFLLLSIILTNLYITKIVIFIFFKKPHNVKSVYTTSMGINNFVFFFVLLLIILSIIVGFFLNDLFNFFHFFFQKCF